MSRPASGAVPDTLGSTPSAAVSLVSLGPGEPVFDLYPPLVTGCPTTSNDEVQYPLRVGYDLSSVVPESLIRPSTPGLTAWQALLPPLSPGLSLGEGGTPVVADPALAAWARFDGDLYIKDESRNPTGSHKDRLNLCTTSAAVAVGAPGIAVASSGNHAISAAAYAARAGLQCVALLSDGVPDASARWVAGFGAAAVVVPRDGRWGLLRHLVDHAGLHPASNLTATHTGHPHGPEGYKTMAYEIWNDLGRRRPGAVFVPTGYGEMLYGIFRGFVELADLGLADGIPRLYACEPAALGPLTEAIRTGRPAATVPARPTIAAGIGTTVSGYRGVVALQESRGAPVRVSDDDMVEAADELAVRGFWTEISCGSSLAALRLLATRGDLSGGDGPVVCVVASSRAKSLTADGDPPIPRSDGTVDGLRLTLARHYGVTF